MSNQQGNSTSSHLMVEDPLTAPSIDGDQLRRKAASAAADAVRSDTAGDHATSILLYKEAAEALQQLLEAGGYQVFA
jgi:hypothetical protein